MTTYAASRDDGTMVQASAWLARLQRDEVTEADGLEFDEWLAADPANQRAYVEAVALWHEFDDAAGDILGDPATPAARRSQKRLQTRRWLAAAGGLAMAAGLAVAFVPPMLSQPQAQTFVTGKGQHQRITLADGSTVDLNAETRLSARIAGSKRQVVISEGEAIFDVAHDPRRPFTVEASGRVVRVVGTQFDVRDRLGAVTVTVARGKVQVGPIGPSMTGRSYLLKPGQRLEVDRSGAEELEAVDPQETFSWRAGRLVYRGEPLAEVVADLNRQFPEQIEIADPELGRTPIVGVIVLDDPRAVVARLSLMLPIRSVPSERGLLLLRK